MPTSLKVLAGKVPSIAVTYGNGNVKITPDRAHKLFVPPELSVLPAGESLAATYIDSLPAHLDALGANAGGITAESGVLKIT
jgi:hypothetical protein